MRVEKPNLNQIESLQKAYRSQTPEKLGEAQSKEADAAGEKRDSVEISSTARALFEKAAAAQNAQPVDGDQKQLASALQHSGLAKDAEEADRISQKIVEKLGEEQSVRESKLEQVKKRLDSGFYNSREVIEKIAEGLMRDMKFSK